MLKNKLQKTAFTLIELSVVLLVLSVLVAGVISVTTSDALNDKIEITKKRMDEIYKALAIYTMKNYALPCPAPLNVAKDSSSYGVMVGSGGSCTGLVADEGVFASNLQSDIFYGAVPVNTLGLADEYGEDGFGSKIVYVVAKNYTLAEYPTKTDNDGFSFKSVGDTDDMRVVHRITGGEVVNDVMFVIISLGKNKAGAYNANSTSQNSAVSSNSYEQENYVTNLDTVSTPNTADFGIDATYSTEVVLSYNDENDGDFDDILLFKSKRNMVEDFPALMFLMGCSRVDFGQSSAWGHGFSGGVGERSSQCSKTRGLYPLRYCSIFAENYDLLIGC